MEQQDEDLWYHCGREFSVGCTALYVTVGNLTAGGGGVTAVKPRYVLQGSVLPECFAVLKSRLTQPGGSASLMAPHQQLLGCSTWKK